MKRGLFTLLFVIAVFAFFSQPANAIKIGLDEGLKQTYIGASKHGLVTDGKTGKSLLELNPLTSYSLRAHNNIIAIKIDGKFYNLGTNYIVVKPKEKKCFLATKKRWYRGEIIVYNINRRLVAD